MAVYIISYIYLLSGDIRVRNLQELDIVAFWSRNLDVGAFQSWKFNVMAFCPLKKGLGIMISWLICLHFSISWCPESRSPRILKSQFFGFEISMSWFFGIGIPMSWYLVFIIIVKTKKITHNYVNYVVEKYFNWPNLCNIYLHNVCINELE